MQAFTQHTGLVAPLDRANVDTDLIIPKQFLKSIRRTGFGPNLFDSIRYLDEGVPGQDCSTRALNPDFVLNQLRYRGASILLARQNFGCGSSREHAPWALLDFGIRVVIAPSFADIFYNNCFQNGLLAIVLDEASVDRLFAAVASEEGYQLSVDLASQSITDGAGMHWEFVVDGGRKDRLINGLDEIGVTLLETDAIRAFEASQQREQPWLYGA